MCVATTMRIFFVLSILSCRDATTQDQNQVLFAVSFSAETLLLKIKIKFCLLQPKWKGRRGWGPVSTSVLSLITYMLRHGEGLTVGPDSDGLLNVFSTSDQQPFESTALLPNVHAKANITVFWTFFIYRFLGLASVCGTMIMSMLWGFC